MPHTPTAETRQKARLARAETLRIAREVPLADQGFPNGDHLICHLDTPPGVGIKITLTLGDHMTPRGNPKTHVWYLRKDDPRLGDLGGLRDSMRRVMLRD